MHLTCEHAPTMGHQAIYIPFSQTLANSKPDLFLVAKGWSQDCPLGLLLFKITLWDMILIYFTRNILSYGSAIYAPSYTYLLLFPLLTV